MAGTWLKADRTVNFDMGRGLARLKRTHDLFNNVGSLSYGVLHMLGNVANGDTLTLGSDIYEVDILNSNPTAGAATVGAIANVTTDTTVTFSVAHGLIIGDFFLVGSEQFRVKTVVSTTVVVAQRARSGTSAASHSAATSVKVSDAPGSVVGAGHIPLCLITTLTPTAFLTVACAEINADAGTANNSQAVRAIKIGTTEMLIASESRDKVLTLATTSTLSNSSAWDATTMSGGRTPLAKRNLSTTYVPVAADVTLGSIFVPVDFAPTSVFIRVVVTSGGASKAWDGAYTYTAASAGNPGWLTIDNSGATDWATTDTLHILAVE